MSDVKKLNAKAATYTKDIDKLRSSIQSVIVGQTHIVDELLLALLANGHVLVEGVPGLAKTMLIKTLSDSVHATFSRLQFTPDLLPADILGTTIYDHKKGTFSTKKGPIFANFILADEINRAPPKVQSALLEVMQEQQVTISGNTFPLAAPFLVMATQNPVETEGTYRLPEAQVDRFAMKLLISYPDVDEEKTIINRMTTGKVPTVKTVLTTKRLLEIQKFCPQVYADEKIETYVAHLVDATRHPEQYNLKIGELIEYGASPRASIWMILAAKAHALVQGRGYVLPEDVQSVALPVLRHRILLSYEAEAENVDCDDLIKKILETVKVP